MGYLLKEALKTLCGVNQWAYAIFWKIGCQNPKWVLRNFLPFLPILLLSFLLPAEEMQGEFKRIAIMVCWDPRISLYGLRRLYLGYSFWHLLALVNYLVLFFIFPPKHTFLFISWNFVLITVAYRQMKWTKKNQVWWLSLPCSTLQQWTDKKKKNLQKTSSAFC